jgi:hypothetical protein
MKHTKKRRLIKFITDNTKGYKDTIEILIKHLKVITL